MNREFTIILERGEDGFYGYCPELPGCTSHGDSLDELQENMKEAISLYLNALREDGKAIPDAVHVSRVGVPA